MILCRDILCILSFGALSAGKAKYTMSTPLEMILSTLCDRFLPFGQPNTKRIYREVGEGEGQTEATDANDEEGM